MKAVAYHIKDFEKELLALANGKVHDLTLISNPLNFNTLHYVFGKEVVIVSEDDRLDADLLDGLKKAGVQKIVTRSMKTDHIDLFHAADLDIQVANTPYEDRSPKGIAEQTIRNLNLWDKGRCVGQACCCVKDCNVFPLNNTDERAKQTANR
ncbi:lactate dehydrogenase [Sphingobacterium oryzagri]|uniref:Lactate dehydrogenase n=1 Tax=Sphingobacterium oryzagri TaxID=3025669 RepID=A0ABY7WEZ1_9SPHI|nr:lactate dehydrogenase [Sphingobacterium sp. KACC 22765]WDF67763.1 lactate dehydrogenase [Sphingobacterium sp. KACC 22765]